MPQRGALPPPPDIEPGADWHGYSSDDRKPPLLKGFRLIIGGTIALAILFVVSLVWPN